MIAAPRASLQRPRTSRRALSGFTVVELMVVVAIIVVLVGILLVALSGGRAQAHMAKSMNSLKQIGTWMTLYSGENRDTVVPSQFNYTEAEYKGKVRSFPEPAAGEQNRGTWTDILWTRYADSSFPEAVGFPDTGGNDYKFDSPDNALYGHLGEDIKDPFRSSAKNTRNAQIDEPFDLTVLPLPFGPGAQARGEPGYFAANNFFNADPASPTFNDVNGSNGWWSQGQIALPAKSLYVIDSWAGEVIEVNQDGDVTMPDCAPWDFSDGAVIAPSGGGGSLSGQVDFRYQDAALILFLDNHVKPETPWETLDQLQGQGQGRRGIRVRELDSDSSPTPCP